MQAVLLNYLEMICAQAGAMDPATMGMQLLLIGEGLIVAMQTMGPSALLIEAASKSVAQIFQAP